MLNKVPDREIQSFHALAGNELICELRKTPTVLYGIFTELVQQFWAGDPKDRLFGTPDIRWDRDPDKTNIWIDTELRWEATHPEFRPAIYVKLSPIQCGTITGNTTGLVRRDLQEAEDHHARTGTGQVSFVHIGATAGEACPLADATMDYLDAFAPVITDDYCFAWFKLVSREPLHAMGKDSNEKYGSVVSYEFSYTDSWSLKLESPKLKQLVVRATDAVHRRLEVGEYWDFKPSDDGLGLPPGLSRRVT
jgi:hypothetical protein